MPKPSIDVMAAALLLNAINSILLSDMNKKAIRVEDIPDMTCNYYDNDIADIQKCVSWGFPF
jgi:hypothetical protein